MYRYIHSKHYLHRKLVFFFKGEEDLCIKDRQKYKGVMDTAQTMDYKEEVWYRKTLAKS